MADPVQPSDAPGLEVMMRQVMELIHDRAKLPPDVGISVFVYHYGDPGNPGYLAYGSSGQRGDCVRMIADWVLRQLEGQATGVVPREPIIRDGPR